MVMYAGRTARLIGPTSSVPGISEISAATLKRPRELEPERRPTTKSEERSLRNDNALCAIIHLEKCISSPSEWRENRGRKGCIK